VASGERITQVPKALLLGAGDLPTPGTQASAELVRPLIRRLEDDATAFAAHQDLALGSESALLWEPDRLTAAILKELRASSFHSVPARLFSAERRQ
jgi:hypothetical protein